MAITDTRTGQTADGARVSVQEPLVLSDIESCITLGPSLLELLREGKVSANDARARCRLTSLMAYEPTLDCAE